MRRRGFLGLPFRVFALSTALTFACASAAFADTVTNLLDSSPAPTQFEEVRVNEGETRSVPLRVIAASEDGEDGCNVDGSEALQLGFDSTNGNITREDPNGSTVTFQDGPDAGGRSLRAELQRRREPARRRAGRPLDHRAGRLQGHGKRNRRATAGAQHHREGNLHLRGGHRSG